MQVYCTFISNLVQVSLVSPNPLGKMQTKFPFREMHIKLLVPSIHFKSIIFCNPLVVHQFINNIQSRNFGRVWHSVGHDLKKMGHPSHLIDFLLCKIYSRVFQPETSSINCKEKSKYCFPK